MLGALPAGAGSSSTNAKKRARGSDTASPAAFDSKHYYSNPEQYTAVFHERVLPYTSVLVNCMYWDNTFPRLVTCDQAKELASEGRLPLLGVCDITCDLRGSVEFLTVRWRPWPAQAMSLQLARPCVVLTLFAACSLWLVVCLLLVCLLLLRCGCGY